MHRTRGRHLPIAAGVIGIAVVALAFAGCAGSPSASSAATAATPAASPGPGEATLLSGMRLDLAGACQPLRHDLPAGAIAGVECRSTDPIEAGLQVYLFNQHQDTLAAYLTIVAKQGITLRSNLPGLAIAEGSYQPGDDPSGPPAETRHANWLDDAGHARYLAVEPPFVLLAAEGTNADVNRLYRWAWRGMQDVPGAPNIWSQVPADPNAKG
jgi:hypothetical protein